MHRGDGFDSHRDWPERCRHSTLGRVCIHWRWCSARRICRVEMAAPTTNRRCDPRPAETWHRHTRRTHTSVTKSPSGSEYIEHRTFEVGRNVHPPAGEGTASGVSPAVPGENKL